MLARSMGIFLYPTNQKGWLTYLEHSSFLLTNIIFSGLYTCSIIELKLYDTLLHSLIVDAQLWLYFQSTLKSTDETATVFRS